MSISAATTTTDTPGYVAGTWTIDPVHSDVSFSVRHLMVSKVRGRFTDVTGEIVTAADPLASSVTASIGLASLDTGNPDRDAHVKNPDYLDVGQYPTMDFRSTGVRPAGADYVLEGELTLHGVTRPVELALEWGGVNPGFGGATVTGFSATGEINRRDFGIDTAMPLDGGGVVVADKITIALEIEAVLQTTDSV